MKPYYEDQSVTLHHGDCLDVLAELPDASVDAVVTDPPYGLGFMGREWDTIKAEASRPESADAVDAKFRNVFPRTGKGPAATAFDGAAFGAWCLQWVTECLRVLKPGGHLLAFGGTRTWHRLAVAVEDAGFEIRDSIAWMYGSGFPKSMDVSKAIDKAAGAERTEGEREWSGGQRRAGVMGENLGTQTLTKYDTPATDAAREWQGWGTALKPAFEPIVVARKPLVGTVAANVLAHGTGALNIDGARVGTSGATRKIAEEVRDGSVSAYGDGLNGGGGERGLPYGRWPANVILDESQAAALDESVDEQPSRFYYTAKAASDERLTVNGTAHPTVKPLDLMRWLVRLVTPPGGTVLEPFAGSGTTVEACILERFNVVAIEREADYLPLITQRINRRRDPAAYFTAAGEDGGLLDLIEEEPA